MKTASNYNCAWTSLVLLFIFICGMSARLRIFNITCDLKQRGCQDESQKTISAKLEEQADVLINIKISQLQLATNVSLPTSYLSPSVVNPVQQLIVDCTANNSASIIISNIADRLTLSSLNITSCGTHNLMKRSQLENDKIYSPALTTVQCRNIYPNKLVIARSKRIGLTILNHQGGRVNIKSTIFAENKLPKDYMMEQIHGGGGVYINLSLPTTFQFDHCTFVVHQHPGPVRGRIWTRWRCVLVS